MHRTRTKSRESLRERGDSGMSAPLPAVHALEHPVSQRSGHLRHTLNLLLFLALAKLRINAVRINDFAVHPRSFCKCNAGPEGHGGIVMIGWNFQTDSSAMTAIAGTIF